MTSKRTYRDALPIDTVIAEIERCKGTQFDPKLADVFLDILRNNYDEVKAIQERYN
jgi:putative two-component system response regulator